MKSFNFTLLISGAALEEPDLDRLFDAGCGDATFGQRDGIVTAEFDRDGSTFAATLLEAISIIEDVMPGRHVVRVEPDDLVTAAVIAERTGRSRESVRLLASGERGPGEFPPPVSWVGGTSRIWHWNEVSQWFQMNYGVPPQLGAAAHFVAALNATLESRRQIRELGEVVAHDDHGLGDEVAALPALLTEAVDEVQRELTARGVASR